MRCYPQDSPQAAARIVILAMLADGHISLKELESLRGLGGEAQLGLDQGAIDCAVRILCEELLIYSEHSWTDAVKIDPLTRSNVLSEIDCPVLRQKILRLCASVINSDGHVSEPESSLLDAIMSHWNLKDETLEAQT